MDNFTIASRVNDYFIHEPLFAIGILLVTLSVAALFGGLMGMLASLPAIRLKTDYLAIMLFVLGYLVQIVGTNDYEITGGSNGVFLPDPFVSLGADRTLVVTLITLGVAVMFLAYMRKLIRSPLGRTMRAIRDNETTAEAVGRNLPRTRLKVMGLGAAIAGLTGGLYAYYSIGVSGSTFNTVDWSFYIWLILILGGVGSNLGVVTATAVLITAREFVVLYEPYFEAYVPFNVVYLEYLVVGALLVVIMIYRPKGILPEKSGLTVRRKQQKEVPKSV